MIVSGILGGLGPMGSNTAIMQNATSMAANKTYATAYPTVRPGNATEAMNSTSTPPTAMAAMTSTMTETTTGSEVEATSTSTAIANMTGMSSNMSSGVAAVLSGTPNWITQGVLAAIGWALLII